MGQLIMPVGLLGVVGTLLPFAEGLRFSLVPTSAQHSMSTVNFQCAQPDRYISTSRWKLRRGKRADWERNWEKRQHDRLRECAGFRYSHLMRQVDLDERAASEECDFVSMAYWDNAAAHDKWRHGTAARPSLGEFVKLLWAAAHTLQAPPTHVTYDGLLHLSSGPGVGTLLTPPDFEVCGDDAKLPAQCFVACNRFHVRADASADFERCWQQRTASLCDVAGCVTFSLLRRTGEGKHDSQREPNYISCTIWSSRSAFEEWREWKQSTAVECGWDAAGGTGNRLPTSKLWTRPPSPVFYEGILAVCSDKGT